MFTMKGAMRRATRLRWAARSLLMVVVAQGVCAAAAYAQNGCPTPVAREETIRNRVADIFISPDFASSRSRLGIHTLNSGVTKTILTDATACNAIYTGIYNNIDSMIGPPGGTDVTTILSKYAIHYFRVGDYYAAMLIAKPNGVLAQVNGWASVMIFNRNTLQFIGVVRA
jgi:hypothetical protein